MNPPDPKQIQDFQRNLMGLNKLMFQQKKPPQRVNIKDDLASVIKQEPAEVAEKRRDYVIAPDIAKRVFGSYFNKYERERKKKDEEEQKKQAIIQPIVDKTPKADLYDLNIAGNLKKLRDVVTDQAKQAVDAIKEEAQTRINNATTTAQKNNITADEGIPVAILFSIIILCVSIFFIIAKWATSTIVTKITLGSLIVTFASVLGYLYHTYYQTAIHTYYFSLPIIAMSLICVAFFIGLYYGYDYMMNTPMFQSYSKIINIVFSFIGATLILALFATIKHSEMRRNDKSTQDALNNGLLKAPFKSYLKYTAWLVSAFILVSIALVGVQFISRESEFTGTFLSLIFGVFMLMTVLYIIYGFLSQIEVPDSAFARVLTKVFAIIYHFVFAIPCFLYEVVLNVKGTPTFVYKILLAQILAVTGYVFIPRIWKWRTERNAIQVSAVNLKHKKTYASWNDIFKLDHYKTQLERTPWEQLRDYVMGEEQSFMDYMKKTEHLSQKDFKYEYSVDFETFFHELPPNTTHLGNQFVHVFSFCVAEWMS